MRGNTNTVTAYIGGRNPGVSETSIIYIDTYVQLAKTNGDGQTGAPGGRLEEHLAAKVTDSKNRAIPGLMVDFPSTGTNSNGTFIQFPGTKIDGTSGATSLGVYTDSSGVAQVYYAFNSDAVTGAKSITSGLKHDTTVNVCEGEYLRCTRHFGACVDGWSSIGGVLHISESCGVLGWTERPR